MKSGALLQTRPGQHLHLCMNKGHNEYWHEKIEKSLSYKMMLHFTCGVIFRNKTLPVQFLHQRTFTKLSTGY
ncbi:hypothetical protein AYY16_09055 [Morganella psychrotolerans]|nr:hypothetical protein AYY16_09055 [Morganella psychrotolerans]